MSGDCGRCNATVAVIDDLRDIRLGWTPSATVQWHALGEPWPAGRVSRIDRGWSTVMVSLDQPLVRVRNIGADVAVGDFVVPDRKSTRLNSSH